MIGLKTWLQQHCYWAAWERSAMELGTDEDDRKITIYAPREALQFDSQQQSRITPALQSYSLKFKLL